MTSALVTGISPDVLTSQRVVNAALSTLPHPDVRTAEGLAMLRAATGAGTGTPRSTPRTLTVPGPGGELRLRVFVPEGPVRAAFLRLHGGGWAAGSPEDDDIVNDQIAREAGVAVISPAYRLVPDVGIADQLADCLATARWLAASAPEEFGTDRLLVGGISAGAHLAAATLVALRDAGDPAFATVAGAVLDCGAYYLGLTPSAAAATEATLVLPRSWLDGLIELALAGRPADRLHDPDLSPLLADLAGMPPALFTAGDLDPLRDDSILMAGRWDVAGNRADLEVWPEAAHAFTNMGTPLGALANARTSAWIGALLDGGDRPAAEPETVVRRFITEVVNGGDLDLLPALWSPDLAWHGGVLGDLEGLPALRAMLAANASGAFTGMALRIDEVVTAGDKVVVRFVNSGTQTGPFLGRPASGRHAAWLGIGIYTVLDGRIVEAWFGEDLLHLLVQTGAVELPG